MAPQKEFESPTFRLGGGRSILLSYWGIYTYKKTDIYRTVADATDAQQMAKSLALLGCHLHAAFGRCILLSYWGIWICIGSILPKEIPSVKKKMGKWILFQFSSLQIGLFRL